MDINIRKLRISSLSVQLESHQSYFDALYILPKNMVQNLVLRCLKVDVTWRLKDDLDLFILHFMLYVFSNYIAFYFAFLLLL